MSGDPLELPPPRTSLFDTFVPPPPTPGDLAEDSAARPPLGDGQGPRLPTAVEDMYAKHLLGLDPVYSDFTTEETA
ncbi:hypothetical protein [Actinomycetospora termitidis]|uniref:Uncharacterized protein n=1 Tax=Actinomycetospora termitidis TaxID=3053470 RepID=A0ABT7MFE7_9PSEU|nr:hypothetical protein [Actinomycetospora sp. Odt1-22]MDL5159396.1 hypothetical protein [Actinomycetospora sp. Odt1-22]